MWLVRVVPPSLATKSLALRVLVSMASLKATMKSTLLRLVSPLATKLVPRSMALMAGAVLSST